MNESISMQIGTTGLRGKGIKGQVRGSEGQRSRLQEVEFQFGGLAEASVLTPLGREGFPSFSTVSGC